MSHCPCWGLEHQRVLLKQPLLIWRTFQKPQTLETLFLATGLIQCQIEYTTAPWQQDTLLMSFTCFIILLRCSIGNISPCLHSFPVAVLKAGILPSWPNGDSKLDKLLCWDPSICLPSNVWKCYRRLVFIQLYHVLIDARYAKQKHLKEVYLHGG